MQRLRELRKGKNITMKQLGNLIGVAESTVSLYENGKREPDNNTLQKLADIFEVSTDYLLGRIDEPHNNSSADDITFDDFTYAMHNESKELTEKDKEMLLSMARMLRERIDDDEKSGGHNGASE